MLNSVQLEMHNNAQHVARLAQQCCSLPNSSEKPKY